MRSHLKTCFRQGNLTPFPRLSSNRMKEGRTKVQQVTLLCHCHCEQGSVRVGRMERCKACRRIIHVSCLPVSPPSYGT
ncbi:Hypp5076 [Branchiostoma lanceolatum]|uniref:Hypp5076 protein n=1 Tax=Branchiostoma lanceolatum TaxID=7740 RepID=A0A8K0F3E0_BRALA|nr:Hypp5076 [Branchiostoma lanceolatum]